MASTQYVHIRGLLHHNTPYGTMIRCSTRRTAAHALAHYGYLLRTTTAPLFFANDGSHGVPCANGKPPIRRFHALTPSACGRHCWTLDNGNVLRSFFAKRAKTFFYGLRRGEFCLHRLICNVFSPRHCGAHGTRFYLPALTGPTRFYGTNQSY